MVAAAAAAPGSVAEVAVMADRAAAAIAGAEVDAVEVDVAAGAGVETSGTRCGIVTVIVTGYSVLIIISSHRSSQILTDLHR